MDAGTLAVSISNEKLQSFRPFTDQTSQQHDSKVSISNEKLQSFRREAHGNDASTAPQFQSRTRSFSHFDSSASLLPRNAPKFQSRTRSFSHFDGTGAS